MSWRATEGIKRDKYDELFSELVRMRANWCCEICGRSFEKNHHGLDCSHIYGRAKQSVRLHPDNALALCRHHHDYMGQHPIEHAELARRILGEQRYTRLMVLANKPTKFTEFDKELIHKHYLEERKRIKKMRMDGVVGRIEFTLP